jgi:hypothetical protein
MEQLGKVFWFLEILDNGQTLHQIDAELPDYQRKDN